LLGQIMATSPMTRFFTSADKLTDPCKAWWQKVLNPLSGVRVTDVDVDKQRAVETRAALEVNMREPSDPEPVHELPRQARGSG
jgi:hypothetical protein